MKANWIISGNHLALRAGKNTFHPSAKDIYTLISSEKEKNEFGIECMSPKDEMPGIRFSKIASTITIELKSDDTGCIILALLTNRRSEQAVVDIVDGTIIDQGIVGNTWFYLTGNVLLAQDILSEAGIKSSGLITTSQYLKLVEKEIMGASSLIHNCVNLDRLKPPVDENENPPITLKANLFPYQHIGYLWIKFMLEETKGCILGDEMGLGKTMQVITEMLHLKALGHTPMLVVAPISLLANWQRECAKFAPSLKTMVHYGTTRASNYRDFENYDVVITSYTAVVRDIHMINMIEWELVTLDEAQSIKNPTSTRTLTCKQIHRKRSLAVSGTPFENHVTDIWSLVDFIQPGLLGSLKNYSEIITDDIAGGERIEPVLSPLMIRRLVSDVAKDLPEKVVSTQPLSMSEEESIQYTEFVNELKTNCNAENLNLGMLQHLRIYCTHPYAALNMKHNNPYEVSVKYQRFCEIVEEVVSRGEKVIVFTSYKKMFDIFTHDVPTRFGIQVKTINGETPVNDRQQIVDWFNGLSAPAMLVLNPKAAGTGLNITGANHVIHYNLEWNPSLEDQSSARAHRRGQKKTVFVYRLYYENTIEEIVNERIERKRDIASTAIIGTDGISADRADMIKALELVPSIRNK